MSVCVCENALDCVYVCVHACACGVCGPVSWDRMGKGTLLFSETDDIWKKHFSPLLGLS